MWVISWGYSAYFVTELQLSVQGQIKLEEPTTEEMQRTAVFKQRRQFDVSYEVSKSFKCLAMEIKGGHTRLHDAICLPLRLLAFQGCGRTVRARYAPVLPAQGGEQGEEEIAQRWLSVVCNLIDGENRRHTTFVLEERSLWMSNWDENGERVQVPNAKLYHSNKQAGDTIFLARQIREGRRHIRLR